MTHRNGFALVALVALSLVACGGQTEDGTGETGSGGATGTGGGSAQGGQAQAGQAQAGQQQGGSAQGGQAQAGQAQGGQAQGGQAQGGQQQGGQAQGGQQQGGQAQGGQAQAGQGQGGASFCCTDDASCGDLVYQNCVAGSCKTPVAGRCWDSDECKPTETCKGASVCPCGALCEGEDVPGTCVPNSTSGWASCAGPGECILAYKGCCPGCGAPDKSQRDGVNRAHVDDHFGEVCGMPNPACPACVSEENPDLAAFCEASSCQVIEVSKHDVSACKVDSDCRLRKAACCDCGAQPFDVIAVSNEGYSIYEQQVCAPGGCLADCAPSYPDGYEARCDVATGHCVVAQGAATGCPAEMPQGNTACGAAPLECEYGDDIRPGCRPRASCQGGTWFVSLAKCLPVDFCTASAVTGNECFMPGQVCGLGEDYMCECGVCWGGPCGPNDKATWVCAKPPSPPCPALAPKLGSACDGEGQSCQYGINCAQTGTLRVCKQGSWHEELIACPL